MYVFVNKSLRVIDLRNGQTKHIFNFKNCTDDEQFTVCRYFPSLKKFILGNTKGEISIYNNKTGQLENKLKCTHEGAISFIEFD